MMQETQVDISYHYPPELLELLCDAVPTLVRSKEGVIDFFAGAGVPARHLADWRLKVKQDKANVRKHEIARSVLRHLNEAGESALAPRREVLKRVAQFEDFSACWENDRYKAQGLVSQIQKLVNVKDSFTRMNLERERERKERQAIYVSSVEAKQKAAEERAALKSSLYKLFGETDRHKRGKQLEDALNNLFAFADILVREAFIVKSQERVGIIEQIDGAVEIDGMLYLVEMKWWDKPIGRQEISPHLVSIYGRADVGGICISYSGFSPAAVEEAKNALAQRVSVLAELQEIVQILEREDDLMGFFREKIRRAKSDRNPFYKLHG
jgi:restriction system protein